MGDALARPDSDDYTQIVADAYLISDLNARFIRRKSSTWFPIAPDDGIEGIFMGDVLIVDRAENLHPGSVVMVEIEGEYCLRRVVKDGKRLLLIDDKGYVPPRVFSDMACYHGTVFYNVHPHQW